MRTSWRINFLFSPPLSPLPPRTQIAEVHCKECFLYVFGVDLKHNLSEALQSEFGDAATAEHCRPELLHMHLLSVLGLLGRLHQCIPIFFIFAYVDYCFHYAPFERRKYFPFLL